MSNDSPEQPTAALMAVRRVLSSDSFIEKALLLALTALLSGGLVPLIIKEIDSERARQEALSQSQVKLSTMYLKRF
jgi:hypothetical protein